MREHLPEYLARRVPDDVNLWAQVQRKLARRRLKTLWMRLAAAAAVVVAVVGAGAVWSLRPQTASAQALLEKAQATMASPAVAGLHSLTMTKQVFWQSGGKETHVQFKYWYEAPGRWRREVWENGELKLVNANNGTDYWNYDAAEKWASVSDGRGAYNLVGSLSPFGQEAIDLTELLGQAGTCPTPKLAGSETVAGRAAYIIELDTTRCPSSSMPEANGKHRIWVDKEFHLVLKAVDTAPDGTVFHSEDVVDVQYGVSMEAERFTFVPPPGTLLYDTRPKPAPTLEQFRAQMQRAAAEADYPLFAPKAIPAGLRPGAPQKTPAGLEVGFDPAGTTSEGSALLMIQRKATATDVARRRPGEVPLMVGKAPGWFLQGGPISSGGRLANGLTVIRDGTLINFTSFDLGKDVLMRLADSLAPVPGGHPALPNPVPLTLAELRARLPHPIFVPSKAPDGLTQGPPAGGEGLSPTVQIPYRSAQGVEELLVLNGPAGCCLDADPRKKWEAVTIRGGITAYYLAMEPQYGGPILWWNENGAYLALSGPNQTRESLARIAESLSNTAQ